MSTVNDEFKDRQSNLGKGRSAHEGTTQTAFGDPTGQHPRFEYMNSSSVNIGARTGKTHKLSLGGAASGVPADMMSSTGNQYPLNDVRETVSGHVLEFNDTPGGERILIKHKSGSGIELRPDGSVVVSSLRNTVEVCNGDNTVIVEGDARLVYKGNLTIDVTGDFNVNCMNYNVNVKSDKKEEVQGNSRTRVFGNNGLTVSGHHTETIAETSTSTVLGTRTQTVKGSYNTTVEGSVESVAKGAIVETSETSVAVSAPDINIAASSLSVFGDTGTVGGENIVHYGVTYYGKSVTMSEGITAPTFHGDVDGTAAFAVQADVTNSQNYDDTDPGGDIGTKQGYSITNTATNTTATAKPTASIMSDYLTKTGNGIRQVLIDTGNYIKNQLQTKKATPDDVRAKLRDPANLNNPEFVATAVASGKLNPNHANSVPPGGLGRVREPEPGCERGMQKAGNADSTGTNKTFRRPASSTAGTRNMLPEYNVNGLTSIDRSTKLSEGITLAKFLGGKSPADIKHLTLDQRKQLCRNYYPHTRIMELFMSRPGQGPSMFADYRLEIVEGFYKPDRYGIPTGAGIGPESITPGSLLDKRQQGLVVVYELIGPDGKIDVDNTFEAATYIKDKAGHYFNMLTLDYDEFDPFGTMNAQIVIEVGAVGVDYTLSAQGKVQTFYNGKVQAKNSLVEVMPAAKFTATSDAGRVQLAPAVQAQVEKLTGLSLQATQLAQNERDNGNMLAAFSWDAKAEAFSLQASNLKLSGLSANTSLYSNTKDADLTYTGNDSIVWDRINGERLNRGLPSLTEIGSPRPAD
jgi:hypothetical protein